MLDEIVELWILTSGSGTLSVKLRVESEVGQMTGGSRCAESAEKYRHPSLL